MTEKYEHHEQVLFLAVRRGLMLILAAMQEYGISRGWLRRKE